VRVLRGQGLGVAVRGYDLIHIWSREFEYLGGFFGPGLRGKVSGLKVQGLGFRVYGVELGVYSLGFMVWGLGFMV